MAKGGHKGADGRGRPPEELRGADKVTALLLTMSQATAHRIIRSFDDREIRLVAKAASSLSAVSPEEIELACDDLDGAFDTGDALTGSPAQAQSLISGAVGAEQVSDILTELGGGNTQRIFSRLGTAAAGKLADIIAGEQPQVAAAILSKLDSAQAAAVIEKLGGDLRLELLRRMIALKPIGEEALGIMADRLSQDLVAPGVVAAGQGPHEKVAAILNRLERGVVNEIAAGLASASPADGQQVMQLVFMFEDVELLPVGERARLLNDIPVDQVALAVRNCPPDLCSAVLDVLSPRSRRLVEAELQSQAAVSPKSIVEARRQIAEAAIAMTAKGLIRSRPDEAAA